MSKFISMVLRHKPEAIGITLDKEGWVDVQMLIDRSTIYQKGDSYLSLTKEILDEVVANNEKQRFEYSDDGLRIRARQGHSVDVKLGYPPKYPPKYLYHGTAKSFVDSIKKSGIDRRKRHHVHLSKDIETATKVGQRHGDAIVLKIDCESMKNDGFEFFETDNKVWLVDRVPVKYIDFDSN
jgi:putative RNA 2'-phosphotransferase